MKKLVIMVQKDVLAATMQDIVTVTVRYKLKFKVKIFFIHYGDFFVITFLTFRFLIGKHINSVVSQSCYLDRMAIL